MARSARVLMALLPTFLCLAPLARRSEAAAHLLKDIDVDPSPDEELAAYPDGHATLDGVVYFSMPDREHGRELWRTDGTTAGTVLVRDLVPGTFGSSPEHLTAIGARLFFGASDPQRGCGVWTSDGTDAGTTPLAFTTWSSTGCVDSFSGAYRGPRDFTAAGRWVFFSNTDEHGTELWRTDGTPAGTKLVRDLFGRTQDGEDGSAAPGGLVALGTTLLFIASDAEHGRELWRSDGTAGGTRLVRDIAPGAASGLPFTERLTRQGERIGFAADDGVHGTEPWRSDGTAAGTVLLADLTDGAFGSMLLDFPGGHAEPMVQFGDALYFFAFGGPPYRFGLWRTDGSTPPTLVAELPRNAPSGRLLTPIGTRLFFVLSEGLDGNGLWTSDGAAARRVRVIPFAPSSNPIGGFLDVDGALAFLARDAVHGCALWRSDGTAAGTGVVADVNDAATECNGYAGLWTARAGDQVLFEGNDGVTGTEVWALPVADVTAPRACPGDCDGSGQVTIDELVRGVGLALGAAALDTCPAFDGSGDGAVHIDELVLAVSAALAGC